MPSSAPDVGAIGTRLLRLLPPENAHRLAHLALRFGLAAPERSSDDPVLGTTLLGIDFPNPVGIAPGFDKHGEVIAPTLALGAGFLEIGGVTPRPQPGNPKPRLFRLSEDEAIVNRMGFNSEGAAAVAARLAAYRARPEGTGIVGVNLAKNRNSTDAAADYIAGIDAFSDLADFLVVNVSSPNTPGLRSLQSGEDLHELLERLAAHRRSVARRVPILLKVAPDLLPEQRHEVAAAVVETVSGPEPAVDGIVVGNTSTGRPPGLRSRHAAETGGLSGRPIAPLATEVLADFYRLTEGRVPLIGVGGIASGADAYARIRAGASLVQLYTALVFHGPGLIRRIKRDLAACLRADGYASVAEAVGADHRAEAGHRRGPSLPGAGVAEPPP